MVEGDGGLRPRRGGAGGEALVALQLHFAEERQRVAEACVEGAVEAELLELRVEGGVVAAVDGAVGAEAAEREARAPVEALARRAAGFHEVIAAEAAPVDAREDALLRRHALVRGDRAVAVVEAVAAEGVDHHEAAEVVVAEADEQVGIQLGFVAVGGGIADADGRAHAVEALAQHDVDDAGDGVGAVDGRGAGGQHFDALDGGHRDGVDVDEVLGTHAVRERAGGDATAVDQRERRAGAEAAQRGTGHAGRRIGLQRARGGGAEVAGAATGFGDELQHVADRGEAEAFDLDRVDDLHRLGFGEIDTAQVGAGDGHGVEGLRVVAFGGRRRGLGGGGRGEEQRDHRAEGLLGQHGGFLRVDRRPRMKRGRQGLVVGREWPRCTAAPSNDGNANATPRRAVAARRGSAEGIYSSHHSLR